MFIQYCRSREIDTLRDLDNVDVDNYISFLRTYISDKTSKPLTYNSQKIRLDCLKSVIRWCQIHRPNEVPTTEIFTGSEYIGINRKVKIDFIPDDVVAQINGALKTEENPYLKYGIIILQSTGMRIGDLLKLRIDCIKPHLISGYTIEWTQHKGRKANKNKCVAGLCDGYCTKPVTNGNICPRLLKRQKCYTCSRYITTPEYLEAHKQHLANLEKQLEEGAIYGEHYAEHFIPTIEVVKVIIERLEGLQNGN